MSCFPEWTYSVYVDGELPSEEARPLEAHLVQCRSCRARVVALQDEADLLCDVLQEREQAPLRAGSRRAPARGLAIGFAPALGVALLAAAVLSVALDSLVPSSLDWINPLRALGGYAMVFDVIFMLRDEAPGLIELAVAFAAMVGISALLTFAVTALFRRFSGPEVLGLLCAIACIALPSRSQAHFGVHEHESLHIEAGETHDGTLVFSGDKIVIDGIVDGDLIAVGEIIDIRGEVHGNLYAAGHKLSLSGVVTGSAHTATGRAMIDGVVRQNYYGASEDFTLAPQGRVEGDLGLWAYSGELEGRVGRNLYAGAEHLSIRGSVERSARVRGRDISLLAGARIGGDLEAALPRGRELEVAPGAVVGGEVLTSVAEHGGRGFARYLDAGYYLAWAIHLVAAFLVGMVLHALAPGIFGAHLETGMQFGRSLVIGLAVLVGAPVVIAIAAFTLIGLPLAIMALAIYATAIYLAGIVVAALVGSSLVHPENDSARAFGLALCVGLVVVVVGLNLPFVGGFVWALVILCGLGLIVDRARAGWGALTTTAT